MFEFKQETHGVLRMLGVASCKIVGELPQKHPVEEGLFRRCMDQDLFSADVGRSETGSHHSFRFKYISHTVAYLSHWHAK